MLGRGAHAQPAAVRPPLAQRVLSAARCHSSRVRAARGRARACSESTGAAPEEPAAAAGAVAAVAPVAAQAAAAPDTSLIVPLLPPVPALQWSTAVDAAVAADVFQFSAAAGAGLPLWSPAGLAVALAALVAAREGRASRLSVVHELSALLATRPAPSDDTVKPVAEENLEQLRARQKAEAKRQSDEAAEEAARAEVHRRVQEAEQARVQAEQAAAKAKRDEQLRVLDAERRVREEAAAQVRREAERKAQAEAAVKAAEEAELRAAAAMERKRLEEAQRLEREEERKRRGIKSVTARFKGDVAVWTLPGALYQAHVSVRVVGAATAEAVEKRELRSAEELRAASRDICVASARNIVGAWGGDVRAKQLLAAGPLTVLDDNELDHWMRLLRVRVAAAAHACLWRLAAEAEVGARSSSGSQVRREVDFAVADVRDVAPPEDAASVRGRMERAVQAVASLNDVAGATALLQQVLAEEREALRLSSQLEPVHAAFYATVLTLTYFLDCASGLLQAGSQTHAACVAFATELLQSTLRSRDSSTWNSFYLDGERLEFGDGVIDAAKELLGELHPLAKALEGLAGKARKVEPVEEEEWPDENAVRAARIADAQESAPVPERVWAMRNAAGTLAMTGARAQAVALLSRAAALKQDWLGSDTDAGLLGELCDLHDVLDDTDAAADVAAHILRICETCADARVVAGRTDEAVHILEGAAAEYPAAAGDGAARLRARARELGASGTPVQRVGVVRQLADAAAPELEVRRAGRRANK